MIGALVFGEPVVAGERTIRPIGFALRSTLPSSAPCVVANGVRETLTRTLGRALDVDVIEPALPSASARRTLLDGALVQRVRGRLCDAFVIVRPLDARRLAALAFGEAERADSAPLSEIERTTLERIVASLVPLCASLCGDIRSHSREPLERVTHDVRTYFEVRGAGDARFAIGFGLSRDPAEAVGPPISIEDLYDVEVPVRAIFARGAVGVPAFARLGPGEVIRFETGLGAPGYLEIGGVRFGRGACGARAGRAVLAFGDTSAPAHDEAGAA